MFVDEAKVRVKGGKGGNGAVAFRREKCEPLGGPSGGDGGHGGSVIFIVDSGLRTLMDFRHQRHFFAQNGGGGAKKNMTGKDGEDMIVKVPPGTLVKDEDGKVLADLTELNQKAVIAEGGRGGKGNAHFATSTNRAPKFCQPGIDTEEFDVWLELKMLADAALIGLPNAGKSTLINMMSTAKAKVGDYPFTTKAPNLGMVLLNDDRDYVVADVPGLVENAHLGKGMGITFLRHVERAAVMVHLIDLSVNSEKDILRDYDMIANELAQYSPELAKRPVIAVGTKIDIPEAMEMAAKLEPVFAKRGIKFMKVSAATGEGVDALKFAIADTIDNIEE
jgi:GTPase